MGCQRCGAAFGVLHHVGGGKSQGAHLNSHSLDFLTCETILVYLDLVLYEATFEIMIFL